MVQLATFDATSVKGQRLHTTEAQVYSRQIRTTPAVANRNIIILPAAVASDTTQ